ncbi:hypothetical protein [Flavisolibacter ginsengisoli]|jgi:hypothetical protein|nr:hypothetical protein [Flavisolibacter ginsengisoli]
MSLENIFDMKFMFALVASRHIAGNGTGIYAVVAFPVPSVLVKDKMLI